MTIPANQTDTIDRGIVDFSNYKHIFRSLHFLSVTYQPCVSDHFHKINYLHMNSISMFLHTPSQDILSGGAEHFDTHHVMFTSV